MPISAANTKLVAFLDELHLECAHADYLIKNLRHGARHWRLMRKGKDFDRKVPPRDIQIWAFALLGSLNRIRQILKPGQRRSKTVLLRCAVLGQVIGPVEIDHICSAAVRRAWEHLDERLDTILEDKRYKSFSHFGFAFNGPRHDHLDFRRFDPFALTLGFGDDSIPLKECLQEVRQLSRAVVAAHDTLLDGRIIPWAPN